MNKQVFGCADRRIVIFLSLCLLFVIYFWLSIPYYSGDVKNHLAWAKSLINLGPMGFFERDFKPFIYPNYPPLAMWLFSISLFTYQHIVKWAWDLNFAISFFPSNLLYFLGWENLEIAFLKLPAILSVFGLSILLPALLNLEKKISLEEKLLVGGSFLLNPAAFYLSGLWGQIDFLPIFFLILAIYGVYRKNIWLTPIGLSLGLLSKPTVLIFAPIILILLGKKFNLKAFLIVVCLTILIFYLFFVPFHRFSLNWPFQLYLDNLNIVARTTEENALNFWGLLFNFQRVEDSNKFLILTYQQWGYLLLALVMAVPLIKFIKSKLEITQTMSILYILSLISFLLLTRMHERYLAPALVFATFLAILNKKIILELLLISFFYLVNLYRGSFQPDIPLFNFLVKNLWSLRAFAVGLVVVTVYQIYLYIKYEN